MADNIQVNPELLRQAATKTTHVNDRIRTVLTGLVSAIDGLGTPWGNDEPGSRFADGEDGKNGYTAARQNLTELTSNLGGTAENHSGAQVVAAKDTAGAEEASATSFKVYGS